jgi:hypothetical protein
VSRPPSITIISLAAIVSAISVTVVSGGGAVTGVPSLVVTLYHKR